MKQTKQSDQDSSNMASYTKTLLIQPSPRPGKPDALRASLG